MNKLISVISVTKNIVKGNIIKRIKGPKKFFSKKNFPPTYIQESSKSLKGNRVKIEKGKHFSNIVSFKALKVLFGESYLLKDKGLSKVIQKFKNMGSLNNSSLKEIESPNVNKSGIEEKSFYGKQLVKGGHITFKAIKIEDSPKNSYIRELSFRVTEIGKEKINKSLAIGAKKLEFALNNTGAKVSRVSLREGEKTFVSQCGNIKSEPFGKTVVLNVDSIGRVEIGNDPAFPTIYSTVKATVVGRDALYKFGVLLTCIGMGDALRRFSEDDIRKLKILKLYKYEYHKDACNFGGTKKALYLTSDQLMKSIIKKTPGMEEKFKKYLPKMTVLEVAPGRFEAVLGHASKEAYENGARALVMGVGHGLSEKELFKRLRSMLKGGAMSTYRRNDNGMVFPGVCPGEDVRSGGDNSVFTRTVVQKNIDDGLEIKELPYAGGAQIFVNLDVLNRLTYQYPSDMKGDKRISKDGQDKEELPYINQEHLVKFTKDMNRDYSFDNEVMLQEVISPNYFSCISFGNEGMKERFIKYLEKKGEIVEISGKKMMNGRDMEKFIKCGEKITKELVEDAAPSKVK